MLYKRKRLKNGKADPRAPYWVRFRYRKQEIRQSTSTSNRRLAEAYERKLRQQLYEQSHLDKKVCVWQDATKRWERDKQLAGKRSLQNDIGTRRWFDRILADVRLDEITSELVSKIRDTLLAEPIRVGTSKERTRSVATVNRYLAFLRSVLNHAQKKGMIDEVPTIESIKEPNFEARILSDDERERLLTALRKSKRAPHVAAMAEFALETGLRWRNIAALKWANVQLDKRHLHVPATSSKSKKPIPVPLSRRAVEILEEQQGKFDTFVFYERIDAKGNPQPITSIKTAWIKATKDAALEGLRFHDLRHHWATQQVIKGVPLAIIAKLGGWQSVRMLEERYAHLRSTDLATYVD